MVNYNNGKIYKIEPISGGEDGDVYIGSTTCKYLSERISGHRSDYKKWKNEKKVKKVTSFNLFDKYGVENCQIVLLELVNVDTKDELVAREGFHIRATNCVNKVIPDRTKKEYDQMYRENNKDKKSLYQKTYRDNNKDKTAEYNKIYRENNKDEISAKIKIYRDNNKEAMKIYRENNKDKTAEYNKIYRENKKKLQT
jgi:hypothetical protein